MVAKYTTNTPGITPEHLALLEKKRASWHKCHDSKKETKDLNVRTEFLAKYPNWYVLKEQIPEQWRAIVESYYGIDTQRLSTTEIGEEMPIDGKPRTRQAIHQLLKKAIAKLDLLSLSNFK